MGSASSSSFLTSVTTSSIPRAPLFIEYVAIWIDEARSDKRKAVAALVEIKKIRTEMLNKNIYIGESRLSKLRRAEKEKSELLKRLSSLESPRMMNENDKIADLSDANRPTKLAKLFSELYDIEWRDSFASLRHNYMHDDRTAIETLLLILKNCYTKCKTIAEKQHKELGETLFSKYEHKDLRFELRIIECQKQIAEITYKDLQQNCEKLIEERKEDTERIRKYLKLEPVQNYCKLCIELTWLMCIKAPPMKIEFIPENKAISNHFRHYTRLGDIPDFVVWPVLFLHDNGPVLSKGVIQFRASVTSEPNKKKFGTLQETKSEMNSKNGSQKTQKQNKDATETNFSENQIKKTVDSINPFEHRKPLDF
ncbi:hypothetical protein ACJMK2_032236 [Sinanodonta woodiana]|uniref:Mitochondria-eating protein C-terminal domain-containing protein n=1 Tax=Sinanodonta woodiana TaxID=1069815 RepID=A0ABD3X2K3_SINWO